jgi:RNA polymerase sigma-70 factor (ECF subfamily)
VRSDRALLSQVAKAASAPERAPASKPLDFASIYDAWFDHVSRWVRALGAPEADNEDLTQEVFLVVRRRLRDFDGRNVAGWLHRIASGQVRQYRRRRWIRSVFSGRPTVAIEELPSMATSPIAALETREKQRVLEHLLSKMSEKRRVAFVLFEIDGYDGDEIADILDIPVNTVWTRLHHARRDFFALVTQYRNAQRRGE